MKDRRRFLATLIAVTVTGFAFSQLPEAPPGELRGLWVVRTSLSKKETIQRAVCEAAGAGFNTLFVQVRGRGDAFYRSRYEPRSESLSEEPAVFDPLTEVLDRSREHGLDVHAWVNSLLVLGSHEVPSRGHVLSRHPEWAMVPRVLASSLYANPATPSALKKITEATRRNGEEAEGVYLDPAIPQARAHIRDVCLDLLSGYKVRGLHLDYIRYPSPEFGFGRTALDSFAEEVDRTLPAARRARIRKSFRRDRLVYTRQFPNRWDVFRRQQVTSLIKEIHGAVKSRYPEVLLTAAVAGDSELAYTRRLQDWHRWMELGLLDGVCPMAYAVDIETFKNQVAVARGFSFGKKVWAGIGAWQSPVDSTIQKIEMARRIRADGFVLFAYGNLIKERDPRTSEAALRKLSRFLRGEGADSVSPALTQPR